MSNNGTPPMEDRQTLVRLLSRSIAETAQALTIAREALDDGEKARAARALVIAERGHAEAARLLGKIKRTTQ